MAYRASPRSRRTLWQRAAKTTRSLAPYGRPHRSELVVALAATLAVVAARLTLPWPLRGIVELTLAESDRSGWLPSAGSRGESLAWLVGILVVVSAILGYAEHRQRYAVARFTVHTVNDARVATVRGLMNTPAGESAKEPGDILARTAGDTARLRIGTRGVLIHVLQHGVFVLGVLAILFAVDLRLGLVYLVGLAAAIAVALIGTVRTAHVSRTRRAHDSRIARRAVRVITGSDTTKPLLDPDRPRAGAEVTRIKGRTSLAVQGILGATACPVLLIAVRREASGQLKTGDLVVVASYLLMLHYPLSRLGRQVTRLGPQLSSAERIAQLLRSAAKTSRPKMPVSPRPAAIVDEMAKRDAVVERAEDERTVADRLGTQKRSLLASAGKAVALHAHVSELPEGYHTPVGDDAVRLSPIHKVRIKAAEALIAGASTPGSASVPPPPSGARVPVDERLPSLHTLLDPTSMMPLLSDLLADGDVAGICIRSVRYKPGDNVVVHYDVNGPSGWIEAVAYASAERDLRAKPALRRVFALADRAARRSESPSADPVVWVAEVGALVQWLPLDLRIPLLADGAAKLGRRLERAGITVTDAAVKPRLLRYWPRRRAVIRFGDHIVKAYRDPQDYAAAERGLRAVGALQRVKTAAYEAALPKMQATVQTRLSGRSPSLVPRRSEPAGVLLAELHRDVVLPVPVVTADDLLEKAVTRAELVRHLVPALGSDLDAVLLGLHDTRPVGLPLVTSHGNFHAGQLLQRKSGLALIDVDRVCLAAAGYDLASYAAHVMFGSAAEDDVLPVTVDSLVSGYGGRPEALTWFLASCILRRAAVPFRHLDDGWPEATAALVASARAALRG